MDELQSIVAFLKEARKLQQVDRFTPRPEGGFENDAEHSWSVAFTCMLLATRIEKELGVQLDQTKLLKMALIHDLAEIETGDTKQWDAAARVDKEAKERAAMMRL